MNDRERFVRTMTFQSVDRPPLVEWGYWGDTVDRWRQEGLPSHERPWQFFHLDKWRGIADGEEVGFGVGPLPAYVTRTLEETPDHRIVRGANGITRTEYKRGTSMPHWIDFPVKDRATWKEFQSRLNPHDIRRYRSDWGPELIEELRIRDCPLILTLAGSFFGWMRDWMGLERLLYTYYDDPGLIHEMAEYMEWFTIEVARELVSNVHYDCVNFWEDMAMKTGPLISPRLFREFIAPHYRRVVDFYRSHGVELFAVDSDGCMDQLIPLFMDVGVTVFHPMEAAAGMDPVAVRRKYGRQVGMWGGIDKRALRGSHEEIEAEVRSRVPELIASGGYVPFIDHHVPPDISLENYSYYQNLLRSIFGMESVQTG